MNEFETIDIFGNHCHFQYTVENGDILNSDKVYFKVFQIPANAQHWFSYTVRILNNSTAKSEVLSYNGCHEFSKKGIPERIIEIASSILNRDIISSPLNGVAGNFLVGPSKSAWERLKLQNARVEMLPNNFVLRREV